MVRSRQVGWLVGAAGIAILLSGCVVRAYSTPATATVYTSGTVHTSGAVAVDSSTEFTVSNYPPEPLYEEVTVSPGYGYVWIDGYWNWNGNDWGWMGGRWVRERTGYIYVAPYYDYYSGRYVYRSGYWSRRDRLPRNVYVREYHDGRPSVYVPQTRDYRARRYHENYTRDRSYRRPPARDYRSPGSDRGREVRDPRYDRRAPAPDRRTPARDDRSPGSTRPPATPAPDSRPPAKDRRPPTKDRRQQDRDKRDDDEHRDDAGHYKRRGDH